MKKRIILSLVIMALCGSLFAQNTLLNRYTPELLWKLGRVSEIQVSPDNKTILYGVSWYNLAGNKGNRDLYTMPVTGGPATKVTSFTGSEVNGIFRPDGKKLLSFRLNQVPCRFGKQIPTDHQQLKSAIPLAT